MYLNYDYFETKFVTHSSIQSIKNIWRNLNIEACVLIHDAFNIMV